MAVDSALASIGTGAAGGAAGGAAAGPWGAAIGAGVGALGALANYMITSEGQAKMQDAYNKANAEEKQAIAEAIQQITQNWTNPDYTGIKELTPAQYAVLGKYTPEIAQYIQEKAPQLVTGEKSQYEVGLQRKALEDMQGIAEGYDKQAAAENAIAQAQAAAQGEASRRNILRDMEARGLAGTGADLLSQISAGQQSESLARQAALQNQAQSEARRQQALQWLFSGASQMRSQDFSQESQNANILNAFNQRAAENLNVYNQKQAEIRNRAQQENLQTAQDIANKNIAEAARVNRLNQAEAIRRAQETAQGKNTLASNIANLKTKQATTAAQGIKEQGEFAGKQAATTGALIGQLGGVAGNTIANASEAADKRALEQEKLNAYKQKWFEKEGGI